MERTPRTKKYVEVLARFAEDGTITPKAITFDDDANGDPPQELMIDRVLDSKKRASIEVGSAGMRYTVMIGGKQLKRWTVSAASSTASRGI